MPPPPPFCCVQKQMTEKCISFCSCELPSVELEAGEGGDSPPVSCCFSVTKKMQNAYFFRTEKIAYTFSVVSRTKNRKLLASFFATSHMHLFFVARCLPKKGISRRLSCCNAHTEYASHIIFNFLPFRRLTPKNCTRHTAKQLCVLRQTHTTTCHNPQEHMTQPCSMPQHTA